MYEGDNLDYRSENEKLREMVLPADNYTMACLSQKVDKSGRTRGYLSNGGFESESR